MGLGGGSSSPPAVGQLSAASRGAVSILLATAPLAVLQLLALVPWSAEQPSGNGQLTCCLGDLPLASLLSTSRPARVACSHGLMSPFAEERSRPPDQAPQDWHHHMPLFSRITCVEWTSPFPTLTLTPAVGLRAAWAAQCWTLSSSPGHLLMRNCLMPLRVVVCLHTVHLICAGAATFALGRQPKLWPEAMIIFWSLDCFLVLSLPTLSGRLPCSRTKALTATSLFMIFVARPLAIDKPELSLSDTHPNAAPLSASLSAI